ncbi:hypothetical protein AUR64_07210 [Haloprofundus marisrubri]|uniref:Uncharacterized protein n=2 Tax=Haloprofundus marisrubri TaxID=1514971 RepID=A0A0W1RC47_9EURY|nr:hypothetical protein AUR64_07210 [Haloprofundus marisrubri]
MDALADVDDLYETAVEILGRLTDDGNGDGEEGSTGEQIATDLDLLVDVAVEAAELLDEIELSTLLDTVNVDELPEAISFEELPEALADSNPRAAVNVSKLVQLINLSTLLTETDLQRTREEYAELEEAVDAFTDDGMVQTDDDGDEDKNGDDDLFGESFGDSLLGGDEEMSMVQTEMSQAVIQSELSAAVEEFRRGIVAAHQKLDRLRKYNEKRFRQRASSTNNSRNPTARSLLPKSQSPVGATRFSTVPKQVRHSGVEGHKRIYGPRFEEEKADE